jgi:hypothetical protein
MMLCNDDDLRKLQTSLLSSKISPVLTVNAMRRKTQNARLRFRSARRRRCSSIIDDDPDIVCPLDTLLSPPISISGHLSYGLTSSFVPPKTRSASLVAYPERQA